MKNNYFKKDVVARHQWLTPLILATQEVEIRRIKVQSKTQWGRRNHKKELAE
jgi:hypothetical protein